MLALAMPLFSDRDRTDLADILDEELSRGSRHGIYLRALAAAEALM